MNETIRTRLTAVAKHAVLLPSSIVMLFPFVWMAVSSFKVQDEIFTGKALQLPSHWQWENYVEAWRSGPFGTFFMNSFIMAAGIVAAQMVTCALASYAFSWVNFKGKNIVFVAVVSTTMVPFEATMIPAFLIIKNLGIMNTYLALILPSATSVFGIFLLRQFFLGIPRDLVDAAKIDGCTHLGILGRIMVPLSGSVMATLALLTMLNAWNSYLWPLLVTNTEMMRPLQIGLRYLINGELGARWPELMAASTFILLPVLCVFLYLQKYFIRGVVQSGIK